MARTKRIQTILLYVILTLGALVMILPFYWMVATSLKSGSEAPYRQLGYHGTGSSLTMAKPWRKPHSAATSLTRSLLQL